MYRVFIAAARTSAVVMYRVAHAAVSAWLITVAHIPGQVVGTALDMTPTILILTPG